MAHKASPPSIKETAFVCPHCGAYTTQYWFDLYAKQRPEDNPKLFIMTREYIESVKADLREQGKEFPKVVSESWEALLKKTLTGLIFLKEKEECPYTRELLNLNISKCYHCNKIGVWVHDSIVFPSEKQGVIPNQDLPEDIIQDIEEARDIVGLSPKGASALLRLAIQKLCIELGETGKTLDDAIASLVEKGLNPLVQKSLDIVRVIGNEAVHPGTIDLNDNRDTANELFGLINAIADQMITHPNTIKKLYGELPEKKRKAIEKRDKKAEQE